MGVGPACANEDGADGRLGGEVGGEGFAHGEGEAGEGEVVEGGGGVDEGGDGGEGVRGDDVDAVEGGGEGGGGGVGVVGVEGAEVED